MEQVVRALVVDDEERIRFTLDTVLRRVGYVVATASNGEEALEQLRDTPFDVAIVDLNLGGRVDGLRVLEAIRWRWPTMAVIILTAHGSLESAMAAIREGVEGYLLKPAKPEDVRQAVKDALERRQGRLASATGLPERAVEAGPFRLDLDRHQATREGERLELTHQEFKLLVYLMQNAHRVVSPPELVEVVRDYTADDMIEARQIVKWYIHRLRQRIEPNPSEPQHIINVRGVGYRFREHGPG